MINIDDILPDPNDPFTCFISNLKELETGTKQPPSLEELKQRAIAHNDTSYNAFSPLAGAVAYLYKNKLRSGMSNEKFKSLKTLCLSLIKGPEQRPTDANYPIYVQFLTEIISRFLFELNKHFLTPHATDHSLLSSLFLYICKAIDAIPDDLKENLAFETLDNKRLLECQNHM